MPYSGPHPIIKTLLLGFFLLIVTPQSFADVSAPIICNKKQTQCTLYSNKLAMGEEVGILNDASEFVAKGIVYKILKGGWKIKITEKYARIKNAYTFVILSKTDIDIRTDYDTYRPPSLNQWGASAGTLTLGVGDGGVGFELSGFYQKKMRKFPVLFRALYLTADANITRGFGAPSKSISVNGYGAMVGSSMLFWIADTIAMRFEGAAGFFNATRAIKGDDANHPDYNITIDQGFGALVRGSIGIIIESNDLQYIGELAPSLVHNAGGMSINLGFAKNLN